MTARQTEASEKAQEWLAAVRGGATEAARRFGISLRRAQRLAQLAGVARPVGSPRKVRRDEPAEGAK